MSEEVRIWQVEGNDKLTEVNRSALNLEERIEKWIVQDISILAPNLLVIGQQVATSYGSYIDLLCIDNSGNLVIVELKRNRTPREVTAQALDYASWVKGLSAEGIAAIAAEFLDGKTLAEAFESAFGTELPEVINEHHAMLVVASEIDASTERIIRYLSETYGVDINAVRFQFFRGEDGREFLIRTFTVSPEESDQNTKKVASSKRTVAASEEESSEARLAYKTQNEDIVRLFRAHHPDRAPNPPARKWMQVQTGISGVHFEWIYKGAASERIIKVAIHFELGDEKANQRYLAFMKEHAPEFQKMLGEAPQFFQGRVWTQMFLSRPCTPWSEEVARWAADTMGRLMAAVEPLLANEPEIAVTANQSA